MTERKRRQTRMSKRLRQAIELMVFEGQKRDAAADAVGMHRDSLRKAFKRPDVLTFVREQQGVLRESAMARTIAHAERLMESAQSEHVQLGAIEYLNPPLQRSEITHHHTGSVLPGLKVVFTAWRPHDVAGTGETIDATPTINRIGPPVPHPVEAERQRILRSLPKPVPHPAMGKLESDE